MNVSSHFTLATMLTSEQINIQKCEMNEFSMIAMMNGEGVQVDQDGGFVARSVLDEEMVDEGESEKEYMTVMTPTKVCMIP